MAHGPAAWLPFIQSFGTVLLGAGAFFLARRQWLTANAKLRLDLFDKRFGSLESIMSSYIVVFQQGRQAQDELRQLHYRLTMFVPLFDDEAATIAQEVIGPVGWLVGIRETESNLENIDETLELIDRKIQSLRSAALREMKIGVPKPTRWI